MKYKNIEWDLKTLIDNYNLNLINLNPPYQRGDIWSGPSKKRLIESIKLKYPLPIFFLYEREKDKYEMVDGQQRTRTIIGYAKGFFSDTNKETIEQTNTNFFFNEYKIAICLITEAEEGEIEDFYYRVNKFGSKLNRPEILKAQFASTSLHNLVERIANSQQFHSLGLFSEATLNRLADIDFIGELLTLIKYGITDKKITVDKFYENKEFNDEEAKILEIDFFSALDDIIRFNEIYPIEKTRYKQRNDFYTLFNFILKNKNIHKDTLDYFYKLLVIVDPDISPSQERCYAFQEYAINCVSQSNSKKAREERLKFFNEFLMNKLDKFNLIDESESIMKDILLFYSLTDKDLCKIEDFYVITIDNLLQKTNRSIFNETV